MTQPPEASQGLSALLGYDREQLITLCTWLLERGEKLVTPANLARSCPVVDAAYAPLTYRLLISVGALQEEPSGRGARVSIVQLLQVYGVILSLVDGSLASTSEEVEIVLTLPPGLAVPTNWQKQRPLVDLIRAIIGSAQDRLWLMSPYLDPAGMDQLLDPLASALRRGVHLTLITHNLQNVASPNSHAVERLRQATLASPGHFRAFSARNPLDEENYLHLLLHAKVVIADGGWGYLGSANLTGHGLRENLEVGVGLKMSRLGQIELVFQKILEAGLVEQIF